MIQSSDNLKMEIFSVFHNCFVSKVIEGNVVPGDTIKVKDETGHIRIFHVEKTENKNGIEVESAEVGDCIVYVDRNPGHLYGRILAKKESSVSMRANGTPLSKSSHNISTEKINVENAYKQFEQVLQDCLKNISGLKNTDHRFEGLKSSYSDLLNEKIAESKKVLANALKYQEWDNLVIAFFGMTNAGKSTIIETFRVLFDEETRKTNLLNSNGQGVDGQIVGTGTNDFTKAYNEYNMTINGKRFVLIDVPGIEGKEEDVKEEIKKALAKAHCVFYVHGLKEKPDAKSVEKIKGYLKDWVKVYSILNIKNTSYQYESEDERKSFDTPNVQALTKQTIEVFRNALGTNYVGNITVQGLLALCAKADFIPSRMDLIAEQNALISSFGSKDKLLQFSNFGKVVSLVEYLSSHYAEEICEAHKKKVQGLYKNVYMGLKSITTSHKDTIDRMLQGFDNFKRSVSQIFISHQNSLKNDIENEITDGFETLKSWGCEAIDEGAEGDDLKEYMERNQKNIFDVVENNIGVYSHNDSISLQAEVENAAQLLKQQLKQAVDVNSGDLDLGSIGDLKLNDVTSELGIKFGDVVGWGSLGAGIGVLIATNCWNPIGWIGAGISLFAMIFSDSEEQKRGKAKNKLSEAIEEARKECLNGSFVNICDIIDSKYDEKCYAISKGVDDNVHSLNQLSHNIDKTMCLMRDYYQKLNRIGYGNL